MVLSAEKLVDMIDYGEKEEDWMTRVSTNFEGWTQDEEEEEDEEEDYILKGTAMHAWWNWARQELYTEKGRKKTGVEW